MAGCNRASGDTDSTLYYDAGHLNINGARLYTDTLIARLRNNL